MAYDTANVFARILKGELPAHVVEDTDHTLTFMDAMPVAPGHALVVPKAAATDIIEVSDDVLQAVIVQVKRIARATQLAHSGKGVRVVQLNGALAGQSVFHLHFHVIPSDEGAHFEFHGRSLALPEVLQEEADRLKRALRNLL